MTQIFVIKALYRATTKTYLIRASTYGAAIRKVAKLKEHRDVDVEFVHLETRPDDRLKGI